MDSIMTPKPQKTYHWNLIFVLAILLISTLGVPAQNAQTIVSEKTEDEAPVVVKLPTGGHRVVLTRTMEAALSQYNAEFKPWETFDYTVSILTDYQEHDPQRAPFALILDVNRDHIQDVILDGRTGDVAEIVCILSQPDGFTVERVFQWPVFQDPARSEHWYEGSQKFGLSYFLWPNLTPEKKPEEIFTIGIPQETESEGTLLKDGAMLTFSYKNGQFVYERKVL